MPRVPAYRVESYSYVRDTPEGREDFKNIIEKADWTQVTEANNSSKMVEAFHTIMNGAMEKSFQLVHKKKKSSEPSWMTSHIRRLVKKRRKLFRRVGRNPTWKKLKALTNRLIKERRENFNAQTREKFLAQTTSKTFHKCVKTFLASEQGVPWTPNSMYQGKTDSEVADELARYFNNISAEYDPLRREDIPQTYARELPTLTESEVEARLLKAKKTTSRVPGDIFASLYGECSSLLAQPVTAIFNSITRNKDWADLWKVKYITVIPKGPSPTEASECRNISCTNFLSKVYEGFVLQWAREEVVPKENQYGGEKQCSTSHFLIDVWDFIVDSLEDRRSAVVMGAIDYSKAFNRLEHSACLGSFARKGASTDILQLLASFLSGRTMQVKIGTIFSDPLPVNAGAPQGSVLAVIYLT